MVASRFSYYATFSMLAIVFFGLTIEFNEQTHIDKVTLSSKPYHIPPHTQTQITLGYSNCIAVLKWFHLINDFGDNSKHIEITDIAARLDTITHLNPYAESAYYMAAMVLPWHMHSTQLSQPLLTRAMQSMPNKWEWPYYRGFNAYWFDHNMKDAARFMVQSAQLPNAPPMVASLAARMHAESNGLDTALIFLYQLLKNKQDKSIIKQLKVQIKTIQTEKILRKVDRLLAHSPDWIKSKKTLNSLSIQLPEILPDGGHIIMNAAGTPISSANRKRFKVFTPTHRQRHLNE